jgi:hypothetical protein
VLRVWPPMGFFVCASVAELALSDPDSAVIVRLLSSALSGVASVLLPLGPDSGGMLFTETGGGLLVSLWVLGLRVHS